MKKYLLLLLLLSIFGCKAMENSASRAFDNANGAIKTGDPKIWDNPEKRSEPKEEDAPRPDEY